jgi:fatty-acyl-CoA synthase
VTIFFGPEAASEAGIGALTLPGLLAEAVARHRDRPAIAFPQPGATRRMSYRQLDDEARALARALLAIGAGKGARVAVLVGNRPEWVVAAFGVTLAGGVVVPLNTWFEPPELDYVLRHCDASVLLAQHQLAGHRYLDELAGRCPELTGAEPGRLLSATYPHLRHVVGVGSGRSVGGVEGWEKFLQRGQGVSDDIVDAAAAETTETDDAVIIYTSGSTARPKGVLHCHRAAALQSWRFARHLCIDAETRTWSAFPLFWTAGFAMVMGATLAGGGCLVLQERFDAGEALRLLSDERVTAAHAWPHQLAALEDHPDWLSTDLSTLRQVEPFGPFGRHPKVNAPRQWTARAAFGLTETFTIISSDPADTAQIDGETHSGHVLPGNAIRIVDPATGSPQPIGADGEIWTRGPTLMKGYVKALPGEGVDNDGWFRTGDAGFVDASGRLHWTGRTSDLIKTGGANVSPVEIEEALVRHPKLKVAHAVGVPDPLLGELVVVCAVAHEGAIIDEDEVRAWLRGRVASYKIPRRVLFVDDADLDFTGSAKIRVDSLRTLAAARLPRS